MLKASQPVYLFVVLTAMSQFVSVSSWAAARAGSSVQVRCESLLAGPGSETAWRGDDSDPFMAFRSNAPHFWGWVKEAMSRSMPKELQQEGIVAGDPHATNYGQVLLQNKKFAVQLIDLDDSGRGPLLADYLRLSIAVKESGADVKYKDLWAAYMDGISGGDDYAVPKFVRKALAQTNAEFLEEQQELLTDNIEDGKLDLDAYELKPMSRSPKWLQQALLEIKQQRKALKDGSKVLSAGWKKHTDGGSQNMFRIWLLVESGGKSAEKYSLVEYKEMAPAATANFTVQLPNADRIPMIKNHYWDKQNAPEFTVTSTTEADFLVRSRFEYPLNQKVQKLMESQGKKLDQYSVYLAYRLGQQHGQQAAGKTLAAVLQTEADDAEVILKILANQYREVIEQNLN